MWKYLPQRRDGTHFPISASQETYLLYTYVPFAHAYPGARYLGDIGGKKMEIKEGITSSNITLGEVTHHSD